MWKASKTDKKAEWKDKLSLNSMEIGNFREERLQLISLDSSISLIKLKSEIKEYEKKLNEPIFNLSEQEAKSIMLIRVNELRNEANKSRKKWEKELKPFKYDKRLEEVAQWFANDRWDWKIWQTEWHWDSEWNSIHQRLRKFWLEDKINKHIVNYETKWFSENLVGTQGLNGESFSIEIMLQALMNSPRHRDALLSSYTTSIWFGYYEWATVFVQVFADFKKEKKTKK